MPQHKSIFEVRYRTLLGAILSSLVVMSLYITSVVMGDSHSARALSPSPTGGGLSQWGEMHPVLSSVILCAVVLYIAINLAQLASRLRLYGVSTHLPMELFPMLMLIVGLRGGGMIVGVVEMLLLLNVIKNLFSSYRATNSAGPLSLAALSLGLMPLFYPPAIVLWGVVPPMFVIFERTLREVIVTIFSLVAPLFSYLYILWMQGGDFAQDAAQFFGWVVNSEGVYLFSLVSMVEMVGYAFVGVVLLVSVIVMHQLDNTIKARRRLVVSSLFAFASVVMALLPSSSRVSLSLLSLPLALLAPILMLRLGRGVSFALYLLLLIVGVLSAFLGDAVALSEIFS